MLCAISCLIANIPTRKLNWSDLKYTRETKPATNVHSDDFRYIFFLMLFFCLAPFDALSLNAPSITQLSIITSHYNAN